MKSSIEHRYKEPWPNHVREHALGLLLEGYSLRQVNRILKGRYGSAPENSTIWEWRNQSDVTAQLDNNERAIALRLHRLMERKLDRVENDIDSVRLQELAIPAGIFTDKQFKRKELTLKERDQSQLLGDLLEAIKAKASELTTPTSETTQNQSQAQPQIKLIAEAQKDLESADTESITSSGNVDQGR